MTTTQRDTKTFLTSASTLWVTFVRLGLIFLPTWSAFYNPSFVSVLIRPHESLPQLEEAQAIRVLAAGSDFSAHYHVNDSVRIPPLVLAVISKFKETTSESIFGLLLAFILLLVDLLIAHRIEQIGNRLLEVAFARPSDDGDNMISEEDLQRRLPKCVQPQFAHIFPIDGTDKSEAGKEGKDTKQEYRPVIELNSLPLLAAQMYYWSPFTILPSSLFYCWQNVTSLFLVSSLYEAIYSSLPSGSLSMASFYLAVAAYLEPYHAVYVVLIILLSSFSGPNVFSSQPKTPWTTKPAIFVIASFAVWSFLLHGASSILVGLDNYWRILGAVYGNTWLTTSPNLSLQWYFRMQMFSRFLNYFGAMFAGIPFILAAPLCLRFFRYPGVLIASFVMVGTLYRPVQVLYDANFALCFFLFCPRSLARMGYAAFIALCCYLVPVILDIVDHWMWLDANNGNANYMFFQCLASNVFLGIVLGQFISASMQRDKALRLTMAKIEEETKQ